MKSEYYLATVVNAYRRAMDGGDLRALGEELYCAARRPFTTAYAFGENRETEDYSNLPVGGKRVYIANVRGYENGRVYVEMRNRFREGEALEILSPGDRFGETAVVKNLRDDKGELCPDAKLVQAVYSFDCPVPLREGDMLRRKENI